MGADELLAQIKDLLTQYLALGPDTPAAPEAEALMQAIDAGGAGAAPGMDAGLGGGMPPEMPPEAGLGMEGGAAPPMPKTFGEANKQAIPALEEMNRKQRPKAKV